MTLLEKLATLADELDQSGHEPEANELDELIKEVARRAEEENIVENLDICPACNGERITDEGGPCEVCKWTGLVMKDASLDKTAFIRKRKGKWCVVSKKNKSLGCYSTRAEAVKRLKAVEYFKHNK